MQLSIPERNVPAIDFLPLARDPYRVHIGECIEIVAPHATYLGVYKGMTI